MLSRIAWVICFLFVGVTCAGADDKAAANKIFVETAQLLKQAAGARPSDAVGLYEKALRNLDSIVANYPSSDLAVQIISGQAIGQVSRISIEKALAEARQPIKEIEWTELEKLRGTWQFSEAIVDGKAIPQEGKTEELVFSGDVIKMSSGPVRETKIKLDPTKKPKTIDIDLGSSSLPAIYELDGDTLKMCIGKTERPKEFKAPEGSPLFPLLWVLKRSKS